MSIRRVCGVALALAVVACASSAHAAARRRLAVLPLEIKGKVTDVTEDTLALRLIQGIPTSVYQVLAGDVIGQSGKACKTDLCLRQIAERLEAQFLIAAMIEVRRKDYRVSLELIDGPTGKSLGKSTEGCELCGIREVGDKMDRAVRALEAYTSGGTPLPTQVALDSEPGGVSVSVNGQARGTTPLTVKLSPGTHKLAFAREGFRPAERSLSVEEGTPQSLVMAMAPVTAAGVAALPLSPGAASSSTLRTVGWVAAVAGIAAAATGAALLVAVDGKPLPESECPAAYLQDGKCTRVRDARLPAGLLLGGGAAAALMGGTTLFLTRTPNAPVGEAHARGLLLNARGVF